MNKRILAVGGLKSNCTVTPRMRKNCSELRRISQNAFCLATASILGRVFDMEPGSDRRERHTFVSKSVFYGPQAVKNRF